MRLQTRTFGCSGMTLILSGIFFCLAFVLMFFFISDSEPAFNAYEALLCRDDEKLVRVLGSETEYYDSTSGTWRTGRNVAYTCNSTNGERDVTGAIFGVAAASFCIPFVLSIIISFGTVALFIKGIFRSIMPTSTPINLSEMAANMRTINLGQQPNSELQVVLSQETYTASEVEEKLANLQMLVQQGTLSIEQYQIIEQQLRSRQV